MKMQEELVESIIEALNNIINKHLVDEEPETILEIYASFEGYKSDIKRRMTNGPDYKLEIFRTVGKRQLVKRIIEEFSLGLANMSKSSERFFPEGFCIVYKDECLTWAKLSELEDDDMDIT